MRRISSSLNLMECAAWVLGQASLWLGLVVLAAWAVGFSLITRHLVSGQPPGAGLSLPMEPPLIGLALSLLGAVAAWLGGRPASTPALGGLVFNAAALALAVTVLFGLR